MPYIALERRPALDAGLAIPETVGELNYCITIRLDYWLGKVGVNYANLNEAIGIIESVLGGHTPADDIERQVSAEVSSFRHRAATRTNGMEPVNGRAIDGVLRAVQLELYRRIVAPYEDVKRFQTADVYDHAGPVVEKMSSEHYAFRFGYPVADAR
jgi:hypothetical protein